MLPTHSLVPSAAAPFPLFYPNIAMDFPAMRPECSHNAESAGAGTGRGKGEGEVQPAAEVLQPHSGSGGQQAAVGWQCGVTGWPWGPWGGSGSAVRDKRVAVVCSGMAVEGSERQGVAVAVSGMAVVAMGWQ